MTDAYFEDTGRLGLGRPDAEPLATETVPEIVDLIEALIERDHAYESGGDVYFSVPSYDRYGELSNRDPDADGPGRGRQLFEARRARLRARGRRARTTRTPPGPRPGATVARAGTSSARR